MATKAPSNSGKSSITTAGKTVYLTNKELLAEIKRSKKTGEMSNTLARMLQLLCSKFAKKGNFVNYCVDEQTTALTKRGWLSHDQISESDMILSYDINTGQLVWSKVKGVYRNQYSGPMHRLTTQGMDALVTPNHKFVSVERGIIPVENIISNEHITLMGKPEHHSPTDKFQYPDWFVELVGWAITEGHYSTRSIKRHSIIITQKHGNKADRIRSCLDAGAIKYKEYTQANNIIRFHCTGTDITAIHHTTAPRRVLSPEFIVSLTQSQRLLLINTMTAGDGWDRPSGGKGYFQKCNDHTNAFLMLCTLAGITTSCTSVTCKTPSSGSHPTGGIYQGYNVILYAEPKLWCKAEHIDFNGGRQGPGGRKENKPNIPTELYSGTIWCPQTEYGTFVCRRNGYIYVTGNSYNEDMQAYAMMMLVRTWNSFNPEKSNNPFAFFTQCIKHSFIQYLNQEKRQRDVRDLLLIDSGLNPSYGYDDSGNRIGGPGIEDDQDFDAIRSVAASLESIRFNDGPIERDDKGAEITPVDIPEVDVEDSEPPLV